MARLTKTQLIETITTLLKNNPDKEVCVVKYQNKLRNGRWGMHAYTLCYDSEKVMCRPWAGANMYWKANLERLTFAELLDIMNKCMDATK